MIPNLGPAVETVRAHVAPARPGGGLSSVDEPDVTPRGEFAGELSFLSALRDSNSGDSPFGLSLAYGIAERTEISLGVAALSGSPTYRRDEKDAFGDLALGVKTQLMGGDFPVALAYQTSFLTSDRPRNDDLADQALSLIGAQTWERLEFLENLGTTIPGSTLHRTTLLYGGSLIYDAGAGTAFSLQANRNQPQSALLRNKLQYGLGISHTIGSAFSLEAQLGQSGRGRRNTGLFLGGSIAFGSAR